jgi:tRNA-specific 2-thiouridylase
LKILVGLSGGLDSTYTAKRLLDIGHEVVCVALIFSSHTDVEKAKRSADELGLPLHVIDCCTEFEDLVVQKFISEYRSGRTPNPCVICNRYCKIEFLYRACESLGCDAFATGHYCSIEKSDGGRYFVRRAKDLKKDQSYMLYGLDQKHLSKMMTPLYDVTKDEVRKTSAELNLSCADDPESMDICFIPSGKYTDFLAERGITSKIGNFISPDGKIYGPHKGIMNYTVGQRKKLGIALGFRSFITKIDADSGDITLDHIEACKVSGFTVKELRFQKLSELSVGTRLLATVKIRYAATPAKCEVEITESGCNVTFTETYPLPAPGQAAVFYDGDDLIFGGTIDTVIYS